MIEDFKSTLQGLLSIFREKLNAIRGHQLSLSFLESMEFSVYGGKYPMQQLGHIARLSPLKFQVDLYDPEIGDAVEREFSNRGFGGQIYKEGKALVITFPPLSEESRKKIVKELSDLKEDMRIRSRRERDEFLKKLKNQKESGEVSEDIFFKGKEKVDSEIEKFNRDVEQLFAKKESELLS